MKQEEFEEKVAEIVYEKNCEIEELKEQIIQLENEMMWIRQAERAEGYREAIEAVLEVLKAK